MIGAWLADGVLTVHGLFVLFLLGGLLAIAGGIGMGAAWVASPWFRWLHFAASIYMVFRVITATPCPLTDLEYVLRSGQKSDSPLNVLLFRQMDHATFDAGVKAQGLLSGLFMVVFPPRRTRMRDKARHPLLPDIVR